MSTTPPAPTPAQMAKAAEQGKIAAILGYMVRGRRRPGEVTVISHSDLFYWWPVWLVGFIMAIISGWHGVHAGFIKGEPAVIEVTGDVEYKFVDELTAKEKESYPKRNFQAIITNDQKSKEPFPSTKVDGKVFHFWPVFHDSKTLGTIFCITLLLVIVITNVHLRGLWSVIVIIVIVLGTIILALAGWLEHILIHAAHLAIHINMGAYFFIATTLFIVWLINFGLFDRQRYVVVTPGQVRLHLSIGEGEIVYDTTGMVFQRHRNDLFRHWLLGFGSGDLAIRPAGGKDPIDLPNVLFVGSKVNEITELIKEKEVVSSLPGR